MSHYLEDIVGNIYRLYQIGAAKVLAPNFSDAILSIREIGEEPEPDECREVSHAEAAASRVRWDGSVSDAIHWGIAPNNVADEDGYTITNALAIAEAFFARDDHSEGAAHIVSHADW